MKTKLPVRKDGESQNELYFLSALIFATLYGLPVLTYLLGLQR